MCVCVFFLFFFLFLFFLHEVQNRRNTSTLGTNAKCGQVCNFSCPGGLVGLTKEWSVISLFPLLLSRLAG